MGASPYIEREAQIIEDGRKLRNTAAHILAAYSLDLTDADQREAARRELLRRSLFANQERKAS